VSGITKKSVCVLGCGPAGLLAAHAAAITGHPVIIVSVPRKSELGGAQFLHSHIPELTSPIPEAIVNTLAYGDAMTYQRKAYGLGPQPDFVSFSGTWAGRTQQAWSMPGVYDELWDRWGNSITEVRVDHNWVKENIDSFALVVSTIPRDQLCGHREMVDGDPTAPHRFTHQTINILPGQCFAPPDYGHSIVPDMTIVYEGTEQTSWYRSSHLFGHKFTEYGGQVVTPYPGLRPARKPLASTCDCFNGQVVFAGRWGEWKKGVLIDDAFRTTVRALAARGMIKLPKVPE
jgi:hypothetical protein